LVVNETALAAITFLARDRVAAVDVIDTDPAVEVTVALEDVVMSPEPEMDMFPEACSAPVGATVVPPLIDKFPEVALREAGPR
jgi:hypothetical protein